MPTIPRQSTKQRLSIGKVSAAAALGLAALGAAVPANAATIMHSAEALLQVVDAELLFILVPVAALILIIVGEAARQSLRGSHPRDAEIAPRRLRWTRS
jgi:hypothetical protein